MIKKVIETISTKIIDGGLVDRWGGYCLLSTGKDGIPYGVGLIGDCFGNTYTFDERIKSVAILELVNFSTQNINSRLSWLVIEMRIHHFVSRKMIDDNKYYGHHLLMYNKLKTDVLKLFNLENIFVNMAKVRNNNCEYSTISLKVKTIVPCDYAPDINPDNCVEPKIQPELALASGFPFSSVFQQNQIKDIVYRIVEVSGGKTSGEITLTIIITSGYSITFDQAQTNATNPVSVVENSIWQVVSSTPRVIVLKTSQSINPYEEKRLAIKIKAINSSNNGSITCLLTASGTADLNINNNLRDQIISTNE